MSMPETAHNLMIIIAYFGKEVKRESLLQCIPAKFTGFLRK